MTRITNFGRKRKFLEAGFGINQTATSDELPPEINAAGADQADLIHPKKKRQKTNKTSADNEHAIGDVETGGEASAEGTARGEPFTSRRKRLKAATQKKHQGTKSIAISGYKRRTEQRRLERISDRQANTVCFACREKGHAAKDCPKATGEDQKNANPTVGTCYRCGSTNHTLSRCKKPEDPLNRFPFASCFVCSGKGHLASSCSQNKGNGIYPNGGSCRLCGENTHLAKDCILRKKNVSGTAATSIFGTGREAGADEDDFHTFKRKNAEVSKDEKEYRRRKRLGAKASLQTRADRVLGKNPGSPRPKKVVFF